MSVSTHVYRAQLKGIPDIELGIRDGSLTFDDTAAPHVRGTLVIAVPSQAVLDALDPRRVARRIRVIVQAEYEHGNQMRVLDLALREREVQHADGTVTLTVTSDEAILDDYAPLADDAAPVSMQGSLRKITNYVLRECGLGNTEPNPRALSSGSTAPYLSRWGWTRSWATGWGIPIAVGGTAAAFFAAETGTVNGRGVDSYGNIDLPNPGTTGDWMASPTYPAGTQVTISRLVASNVAASYELIVRAHDGAGHWVGGFVSAAPVAAASGAWVRLAYSFTMPAGASRFAVSVRYVGSVAVTSGSTFLAVTAIQTTTAIDSPWRDGALEYAPAHEFDFTGSGADADAFTWKGGQSAIEFLQPLVQVAGLRLVCDELRRWTLRDETYEAPGSLAIRHAVNLIDGTDGISREDGSWFDAAVTRYTWTDTSGTQQERLDAVTLAQPPTRVRRFEKTTAYPGPGFSAYAVRRAQGQGREVTTTSVSDWSATAEQPIAVTLQGAPVQTGRTSRVEFDLSNDRMTVLTRTTDTLAGAVNLLLGTVNALPGTVNAL